MNPPTRIQRRAQVLWASCCQAQVPPVLTSAWANWLPERPLRHFDDVMSAMQGADGTDHTHDLIHCWRDAAIEISRARSAAPPAHTQLVLALLLMAVEQRARVDESQGTGSAPLVDRLRQCDEPLAAELLAACLGGHGLLLEPAPGGAGSEAANVMRDVEAVEYRHLSPQQALHREADAALGALRAHSDQAETLAQRRKRAHGVIKSTRSTAALRSNLDNFRRRENVNLMFIAPADRASQPLRDAEAVQHAEQALGIPVYLHGPAANAAAAPAAAQWSELVADITEPFREAIAALFSAPAVQALADTPLVFVSYSHDADDQPGAEQVFKTLRSLEKAGSLRVWRDSRSIPPGAQFDDVIRQGIQDADLALVLVSTTLLGSDYVLQHELPAIQARIGQPQPLVFFPFLLRHCNPGLSPLFNGVSFKLGTHQALGDCTSDAARDQLLTQLSDALVQCLHERRAGITPAARAPAP